MDLEISLPSNAETISPIFVTAPMNHSGAAMIQRALCTGENSICYGDNPFDEILYLIDWAINLVERHQGQKDWEEEIIASVLNRTPVTWAPDMSPPTETHSASLMSVIYNLPFTMQRYAEELGRSVWGISRASIATSRMNDLASLFPASKSIFIHRNPLDIVRDALRDGPDTNVRDICDTWNTSTRDFLGYSSDRLLKLRYEDASTHTDDFLSVLEGFTGAKGINPAVVTTDSEAENESDYTVSDDLKSLIQAQCGDMLAVYYPDLVI